MEDTNILTRHQQRLKRKEERSKKSQHSGQRRYFGLGLALLAGVAIVGAGIYGLSQIARRSVADAPYTASPVHWHANFEVYLCGVKQDFSKYGSGSSHQGGGLPLIHTHGDGVIHVEGRILRSEDITLGRFFDALGLPFSKAQLLDRKTGEQCSEKSSPGAVRMLVNGVSTDALRDYIIKDTLNGSEQVIVLRFE